MTQKDKLKAILIFSLALVVLGGDFLHLRIHPPGKAGANVIPPAAAVISLFLVTALLARRATVIYGFILNGMLVILGTVLMGHLSLAAMTYPVTLSALFLMTLLPDIFILWGKFGIGKAVYELDLAATTEGTTRRMSWRVPNNGWWLIHLIAISLVYYAGHVLWRAP